MRWRSEATSSKTKLETELGDRRETSVGEELKLDTERSGGEEIGAPESTLKTRRSGRVGAIQSGFTNEKGFRGAHFKHISGFNGEREIPSGIPGYFPDFDTKLSRKVEFIPDLG